MSDRPVSEPAAVPAREQPVAPVPVSRARQWKDLFIPNQIISSSAARTLVVIEVLLFLLIWMQSPFKVLPRPAEVLMAFQGLWARGMGHELWVSLSTNMEALLWSSVLSLGIAYLSAIPVFRPVAAAIAKGRFLSMAGFTLIFTLLVGGGHSLKVALLVFGMSVFYVTSMVAVVNSIPKSDFNHARTLRMNEWKVWWEVVVLGTADKAFEVMRQNAAIGWMMLTMVEGIVRSEGGIGAMLLAETKHFRLADVFAIQIAILGVGLVQDAAIGWVRRFLCPYADLTLERPQ